MVSDSYFSPQVDLKMILYSFNELFRPLHYFWGGTCRSESRNDSVSEEAWTVSAASSVFRSMERPGSMDKVPKQTPDLL